MPKPIVTLSGSAFNNGMSIDDRHSGNSFSSVVGMDIYSKPGTTQLSRRLTQTTDTVVDDQVLHIVSSDTTGVDKLYAYAENGDLYSLSSGTWSLGRAVSNSDGEGLFAFADNLYYFRTTDIGRLNNVTYNDTYWSGLAGVSSIQGADRHPAVLYARNMLFGHANKVGKLESDETTADDEALILPDGYEIYSMTVWNDFVVIGTKNSSGIKGERVILWDGVSTTISQELVVPDPGVSALFDYNNSLKAFIGGKVFRYTGSEFEVEKDIGIKGSDTESYETIMVDNGAVDIFNEKLLMGVQERSGAENFVYGVYALGRHSLETNTSLSIPFLTSQGNTSTEITALTTFDESAGRELLYVAWKDTTGTDFGIDKLDVANVVETGSYLLTNVINLPEDFGRAIKGMKVDWFDDTGDPNDSYITVKYRIDEDIESQDDTTNFTTLGTITSDNRSDILYGIFKLAKKIQLKLEFTTTSTKNIRVENIYIY